MYSDFFKDLYNYDDKKLKTFIANYYNNSFLFLGSVHTNFPHRSITSDDVNILHYGLIQFGNVSFNQNLFFIGAVDVFGDSNAINVYSEFKLNMVENTNIMFNCYFPTVETPRCFNIPFLLFNEVGTWESYIKHILNGVVFEIK